MQVTRKRSDAFQPGEYTSYLRYLVFSLETAVRAMKHGQEKWWVGGWSHSSILTIG